jgi:zinc protease
MPAADVLAHLLSGDDTALLPRTLRIEKQIVDAVDASSMSFERAGAFLILAQLDADKAQAYLKDIAARLASLKATDFTEAQIARAKLNLEDNYLRGLENISNIAETMGSEYFYDPASVGGERWLSAVRGVDRSQIQKVIDQWLRPDALTVAALVPQAKDGAKAMLDNSSARESVVSAWPATGKALSASKNTEGKGAELKTEIMDLGKGRTLVLLPDHSLPYVSASLAF